MKHLLILLAVVLSFGEAAKADQSFDLLNNTGGDVCHVYVAPSANNAVHNSWGNDVLGMSILTQGNKAEIDWQSHVGEDGGYRYYDVSICVNGTYWIWNHLDLLHLNTLVLTWDGCRVNGLQLTN
jgi:hypothetical protein